MSIKAIIFDTDGMVVNGEMFSVQFSRKYSISYDLIEKFFINEFQDCLVGKADVKEVLQKYLPVWKWEDSVDSLLNYWFTSEHHIDQQLVDYTKDLRKRGRKCYLATNQEKYRVKYALEQMKFGQIFDQIFFSALMGYKKPQKEFFEKMMKELASLQKHEVLYWDDVKKDVKAARDFGFYGEVYTKFEDFKEKVEEYLLN